MLVLVGGGAAGAATSPPGTYHPPVDAPVTDPFRPPSVPWGPGNRGIEYATRPGTPVVAIGPGVVVFAGVIAGERYVTVRHPDGLRSSYSYLATIAVAEGDTVSGVSVVGLAGPRLHLGVRRGDVYLDPASLWGRPAASMRPVLVPLDGGAVTSPSAAPSLRVPDSGRRAAVSVGPRAVGAAALQQVGATLTRVATW